MPFETYTNMLRHIYCGELRLDSSDCLYVLAEAAQYGVKSDPLEEYCATQTMQDVSVGNCVTFFEACTRLQLAAVRDRALRLMIDNFPQIRKQIMKVDRDLQIEILLEVTAYLWKRNK